MPLVADVAEGTGFCSVADMTIVIRQMLGDRPLRSLLTVAPTSTDGVTATALDIVWSRGDRMEFEDQGEEAMVRNDPGGATALVLERGINGTTAGIHSDGCVVLKGYRYRTLQITDAIENAIFEMNKVLWNPMTQDIAPVRGTYFYTLNADYRQLIDATQLPNVASPSYLVRYSQTIGSGAYFVGEEFEAPVELATTGKALRFPSFQNYVNPVHVTYKADLTDTTITCGLMANTVEFGACANLVEAFAIPRVSEDVQQGDVTVGPTNRLQVGLDFRSHFTAGMFALRARLNSDHRPQSRYVGKGRP